SARCRPSALDPSFWFVMNQAAWNQLVSGNRAPSKSVPAITDVSRSHSEQRRRLRRTRQAFPPPQLQRKPSGQRRRSRNARQSSSERNQLLNSSNVRGYSRPARGTTGTVVARAGRTLRRWPDVTNWQQPDTPVAPILTTQYSICRYFYGSDGT